MTNPIYMPNGATVTIAPPSAPAFLTPPVSTVMVFPTQGVPGAAGAAGTGTVYGESPTGTQNGSNLTLTLSQGFQTGTTCVYRNGLREALGVGYAENSPHIVFTSPPLSSDSISVDYLHT